MTINLKIPDIRELKPRITVFGVGGAGGNAVNNMIASGLQGVEFVVANTDAQALTIVEGRAHHPDGRAGHRGSRRRLAARSRARRRRRGARRDPRSSAGRAHGVRHRRHGRRHRHRRGAGGGALRQGDGHPHRRRGHQAVPLRGRAPDAGRRGGHQRTAEGRRHAAHHPEPEPVPGGEREDDLRRRLRAWPTRCSIRASPASPT